MESRSRLLQRWLSIIVAVKSASIMLYAIWYTIAQKTTTQNQIETLEKEFSNIHNQSSDLSKKLQQTTKNPQTLEAIKFSVLLIRMSENVKAIQTALGSDIEKSLSL